MSNLIHPYTLDSVFLHQCLSLNSSVSQYMNLIGWQEFVCHNKAWDQPC